MKFIFTAALIIFSLAKVSYAGSPIQDCSFFIKKIQVFGLSNDWDEIYGRSIRLVFKSNIADNEIVNVGIVNLTGKVLSLKNPPRPGSSRFGFKRGNNGYYSFEVRHDPVDENYPVRSDFIEGAFFVEKTNGDILWLNAFNQPYSNFKFGDEVADVVVQLVNFQYAYDDKLWELPDMGLFADHNILGQFNAGKCFRK